MPIPSYDVRIDWDRNGYGGAGIDVIGDVLSMTRNDGLSDAFGMDRGSLSIRVQNPDGKYSDNVATSPLFGKLRPRRPIHVNITPPSLSTVGFFDGWVDDIVPIDQPGDPVAEILCSGYLTPLQRQGVEVAGADRSYAAAHTAVLAAAGVTSLSLPATNVLQSILPGYSFRGNVWDALTELHLGAGSRHAIKALPSFTAPTHQYVLRDRDGALEAPTAATLVRGTDFERITEWAGVARQVVNHARVKGLVDVFGSAFSTVWEYPGQLPISISAGGTVTVWADFGVGLSQPSVVSAGSGTTVVTTTYFERSAKIVLSSVAGSTVTALSIVARTGPEYSTTAEASDSASQALYDVASQEISSRRVPSRSLAQGLADWYVYRYKSPPRIAKVVQENQPASFSREIFDVLGLTDSTLGLTGWRCEVIARETTIDTAGEFYRQTLTVQELPAQVDFFTVGTDAIGGSAILGY